MHPAWEKVPQKIREKIACRYEWKNENGLRSPALHGSSYCPWGAFLTEIGILYAHLPSNGSEVITIVENARPDALHMLPTAGKISDFMRAVDRQKYRPAQLLDDLGVECEVK